MLRRPRVKDGIATLVVVLILLGTLGSAVKAKEAADNATQAARLVRENAERLRRNAIAGCQRNVADRVQDRDRARASARANRIVATDPRQPRRTRRARAAQVLAEREAIRGYEMRMPLEFRVTRQGKLAPDFSCEEQYR